MILRVRASRHFMSLIPSESHSFPDNYSPVARVRKPKKPQLSPARPVDKPAERKIVPLPTTRQTQMISPPPSQPADEQFFQALTKMAGNGVTPPETVAPPKPSEPEPPTQAAAEQFFQTLVQMAGNNLVPPAIEPPPEPPVAPTPAQDDAEQFFQALTRMGGESVGEENGALPTTKPLPKKIVPMPIRRMPPITKGQPLSPADVDESLLLTANGHGRPAQDRPRTPMRRVRPKLPLAKKASAPSGISAPPQVAAPVANTSFVEQPNNDFDFADLSSDFDRRSRRAKKFGRFILIELIALAVLIPSAWLILSRHVTHPALMIVLNILTIAAGVTMAVVPIILYAIAPGFAGVRSVR